VILTTSPFDFREGRLADQRMTDRAERRRRQKDLRRLHPKFSAIGLTLPVSFEQAASLTLAFADKLSDRVVRDRATAASIYRRKLFDLTLSNYDLVAQAECKKGCSFCCKNFVAALPPDIFALVRQIQANPEEIERIKRAESATRGRDIDQRMERRDHCALLKDEVCTVYAARPLACRAFMSTSLSSCQLSFEGGPDEIPTVGAALMLRATLEQAMFAALRSIGLSDTSYELNQAVVKELSTPDAERRWLAGEDIFGDVLADPASFTPEKDERAALMLTVLIAGSRGETPPPNPWMKGLA
jgi:Fe-S-cluster containining protein